MTRPTNPSFAQPTLDDLMVRFLATRSDAFVAVESGEGEVEPHEVAAGFRVDPRAAWLDATTPDTTGGRTPTPAGPPPEWAALVAVPAPAIALPMAAGHFPQRVKDLTPLLTKFNPNDLRPSGDQMPIPGFANLRAWLAQTGPAYPQIAAGIARTLGDFDIAAKLLQGTTGTDNDQASLQWMRGETTAAHAAWNAAPESPPVLFNRGLTRLFLGQLTAAGEYFQKAIDVIPETSGWHALARVYLAVAELHGSLSSHR